MKVEAAEKHEFFHKAKREDKDNFKRGSKEGASQGKGQEDKTGVDWKETKK